MYYVQSKDDARLLMRHIGPNLGKPLPEKSYGGNCLIYDPGNPEGAWHNFWVNAYYCLMDFLYF